VMTPDDDLTPSLLQAFTDRHLATAPSGQFLAEQEASDAATKDAERQTAARDWLRTQGLGDSVPSPNDYDYGRMFDDGIYPSKDAAGRVPLPPQYWKPGRMLIGGRDIATGQRIASRVPLEDRILSGVEDDEPDDGDGISTLTQDDIAELSSRERRVLEAWMESHGVMIAAGPSQTRTDAPTGYYPKPNRPPTLDDLKQRGTDVWDVLAGALKGGVAQTLGLPGDVESLIRMLTGGEQVMPTTEDMEKKLPPVIPPTLSSLVTGGGQREANAAYGETAGEFIGLGKAPTAIAKGVVKGAQALGPTAGDMARRGAEKVVDGAGGRTHVVPPDNRASATGAQPAMTTKKEYAIDHRPMTVEGGAAQLHDLTTSFGEDVYGPNALQFYGSGDTREKRVLSVLKQIRGKPDAMVTIYRGVPAGTAGKINAGDWVTLDKAVAADYGPEVVSMQVPASHVTSWSDSLLEFGYYPPKAKVVPPDNRAPATGAQPAMTPDAFRSSVFPVHKVQDSKKFEAIYRDMVKNGWTGRPILAIENDGAAFALTGSHRIAAAKKAGIDIPVIYVDETAAQTELRDGTFLFDNIGAGDDRVADMLREAGDARAADLMEMEFNP
jgi:hypothetical protein